LANAPNPFSSGTAITYQLAAGGHVRLGVYNLLGEFVDEIDHGYRSTGIHTTRWDGRDGGGRKVAAGIYLLRLQADGRNRLHRMLLINR
jgi:flagellar hook assembly protein FlgD